MSESRNGESRSSTSSAPLSFGESRNGGESRATPDKSVSRDIGDIRARVISELYDELYE